MDRTARAPVTFFVPSMMGVLVTGSGMTYCPCRVDDPGGVVTGPGVASV